MGLLILTMGCGDTSPSDTSPGAEDSASGDELTDTTTSSPDEEDQSADSPDDAVDGCVNTFGVLENVPAFLSETGRALHKYVNQMKGRSVCKFETRA